MTHDDLARIAWDAGCGVPTENGGREIPRSVLNAMALAVAGERAECAKMFKESHPVIAQRIMQRINVRNQV